MSNPVRAIPQEYHTVTPYLTCKNSAQAIDFYKSVFGAKEIMRMAGPDGKIGHAEIQIGDSRLMLADEFPGMSAAPTPGAKNPCGLFLYLENVDATFNRAVSAGAKVDMPLDNQFWGDRYGKLKDPFGHKWSIATHTKDMSQDEMKHAMDDAMQKMGQMQKTA